MNLLVNNIIGIMHFRKDKNGFHFHFGLLGWLTVILGLFIFTDNKDQVPNLFILIQSIIEAIMDFRNNGLE